MPRPRNSRPSLRKSSCGKQTRFNAPSDGTTRTPPISGRLRSTRRIRWPTTTYAGDLGAAQTSLKRAIEIEPKVAGYHYHLGVVQRGLKDNAGARLSLQKALELDPKMSEAEDARKMLRELPAS